MSTLRKQYIFLWIFALFFSACEQEETLETYTDIVKLSTQIQNHEVKTRATIGTNGVGDFSENDQISLFVTPQLGHEAYHELTLKSQGWTPTLSWKELGEEATFSAFYPSNTADYRGEFTHVVELNQSLGNNFEKSDLLHASTSTLKGKQVNLVFNHLMSCLTVKIGGSVYTEDEIAKATLIVKAYHKIQIKKDGRLGELHDYNSKDHKETNASEITLKYRGNSTFQAILCPQDISKLDWGSDWLKIRIKGKEHQLKVPNKLNDGSNFESFQSGKNITLTLNLDGKDVEFINQTRWVYGIKDMPDVNTWKYYDAILKFKGLTWDRKYGWYDCNKVSTENPGDMNLCWAASCSNLIHWWMDRNQEYLDKYQYNGPRNYSNHLESEVFQAYKDNFIDKGYFEQYGLSWFFLGKPVDESLLENKNSGGYFKDVFNESLIQNIGIADYKSLNRIIKSALKNKQAICFSILMKGFGSAHAMTIWGAEFNERGHICAIYYTDNNDRTTAEQPAKGDQIPAGILVARVGEYEGKYPEFKGYAAMEGSTHELSLPIKTLTLLNLGQDQWEAYFKKHPSL